MVYIFYRMSNIQFNKDLTRKKFILKVGFGSG